MQKPFIIFISLFLGLISQATDSQAQLTIAQKADSLFNTKKYNEASILYKELLAKHDVNRSNTYLKLAFISEQSGDFLQAIYYLNDYYALNPSTEVYQKIKKLANENSYDGYADSDLNFFFLLFKQYFVWFLVSLVSLSFYALVVMFIQRNQNKFIPLNQKLALLGIILFGLAIINIPKIYKQGIVGKDVIFLREKPSSASSVAQTLTEGTRVNIVGKNDMWLTLFVNRELLYARQSDIWIIDKD
jgi:uncharacterized protein YgiM (DUF1202 family)